MRGAMMRKAPVALAALAWLAAVLLALAPAWDCRAAGAHAEPHAAAQANAAFREACDLYERGDFGAALAGFEAVRDRGIRNAAVFYNLGNCYYRQDQLGRSIASYRRALLLDPRDGDARANLGLARASVYGGDSTAAYPAGFSALGFVSPRQAQTLFYVAYYLAAVCFLGVLFLGGAGGAGGKGAGGKGGKLRRWALYGLAVALAVAGAAFGLSRYGASRLNSNSEAVVVADRAVVKSGPGNAFEEVSILPDGAEVRLRARSGMWVEVTLPTGEVGWLRQDDLETI